jgi:hypothetical protein
MPADVVVRDLAALAAEMDAAASPGLVPVSGAIDRQTRGPRHPFFSAGFIPVESTILRLVRRNR